MIAGKDANTGARKARSMGRLGAYLWLCLGAASCNPTSPGQSFPAPPEMDLPATPFARPDPDPLRRELANSLVVYFVEDRRFPLVTVSAFVAAGTADGVKEGSAESLSRDLRRGPGNLSSGEFEKTLYRLAAQHDVTMSAEETEITLNVASDDVREAIRLLAGSVRRPAIGAPAAAESAGENPSMETARVHFRKAVLGSHTYGLSPQSEDYRALSRNDVALFHGRYFVPANTVLAVAGDFDRATVESVIEEEFGDWRGEARPARSPMEPVQATPASPVLTFLADKLQGWVVLGHELPVVPEQDWAALEVMNYVLGGGHFDTRLFRVTRDRRGLTNDASGFLEPAVHGPGTYSFRTSGRPQVVRLLIELTLQEIEKIQATPVSDQELFVAQGALADGDFAMRFADGHATARTFALEWLRFGNHSRSASYPERIRAVTREEVQNAAQKYLHPERMKIVVVGPIEQIEEAPAREGERKLVDLE